MRRHASNPHWPFNDPTLTRTMAERPLAHLVSLACFLLVALVVSPAIAQSQSSNRRTPLVKAVENCRFSVVNLRGQKSVPPEGDASDTDQVRHVNGMGTGVVIDRRGYILTNYHVVEDIRSIQVTLGDHRTTTARLIARDPATDLAIIKIDPCECLEEICLGSSSDLMLAETVAAVGNAYGYEHTVTTGIISHLDRNVQINDTQVYEHLIQTDAPINPGNSGGPLLNMDGEMIGINVAVRVGAQGIAFAIPVNEAIEVAAKLLDEIVRTQLDVGIAVETQYDLESYSLMVTDVAPGSAAEQAGIRAGDQVRAVNGNLVGRALDWECSLIEAKYGDSVQVGIRRGEADIACEMHLDPPKQPKLETIVWNRLGLRLKQASDTEMAGRHKDYLHGLKVESVRPNSPAEKEGIKPGDILVAMHGYMTESFENLAYIVDLPELKDNKSFIFYILRDRERYFGQMRFAERPK